LRKEAEMDEIIYEPVEPNHEYKWQLDAAALPPMTEDDPEVSEWCLVKSPDLVTDDNTEGYAVAWYNMASDLWITTTRKAVEAEWWQAIKSVF
jgi:hypothetical protein